MNMLELTAISKQYPGGVQAVDQVSLTLKEGSWACWSDLPAAGKRRRCG